MNFTSPSGKVYTWDKPVAPTQSDVDAIVNFDITNRLQSNAQLVGAGDKEAEKTYRQAYQEYYAHNPVSTRLADAVTSFPGAVIDGAFAVGKALSQWHEDVNKPTDTTMGQQAQIIGSGAVQGVKNVAYMGMNLLGAGFEQFADTLGQIKGNPNLIKEGADLAVARLKTNARAEKDTQNPYQPGSAENAMFEGGRTVGQLAVPLPVIGKVGQAAEAGGEIVGQAAAKTMGTALKAVPPVANAAMLASTATGAVALPKLSGIALLAKGVGAISKDSTFPFSLIKDFSSTKRGLFNAISEAGDRMIATPEGKTIISHLANSDDVIDAMRTNIQMADTQVSAAKAVYDDAVKNGDPAGHLKRAWERSIAANEALRAQQDLQYRGIQVAKWMENKGAGVVSKKTADAIAGFVEGSLGGYVLDSAQSQPGEARGDASAMFGLTSAMLGGLGQSFYKAKHGNNTPSLRERVSDVPLYEAPTRKIEPNVIEQYAPKPSKTVKAPEVNDVIGGVPINESKLADAIKETSVQILDKKTAEIDKAAGHTYDYTESKARGSTMHDFQMVPDTQLQQIAQNSVPLESSWIDKAAYDPSKEIALLKLKNEGGKRGNVSTYALPGVTPEKFNAFIQGLNQMRMVESGVKGSHGKYFNDFIKQYENHWRIKDNVWGKPPAPAIPTSVAPVAPMAQVAPQAVPQAITPVIKPKRYKPASVMQQAETNFLEKYGLTPDESRNKFLKEKNYNMDKFEKLSFNEKKIFQNEYETWKKKLLKRSKRKP